MTISSTDRVAGPFTGNDSAATFPFAFKVFLGSDLEVVELDTATGTLTTLALTTDYTVAVNSDQDADPGGSVTLTAGDLATGKTLTITTDIAALQGLDLTNGGGFYPDVVNAALDRLTILVQQLAVAVSRSLQVSFADAETDVTLPAGAARAGKLLGFDEDGNIQMTAFVRETPDGDIPGRSFTLPSVPATAFPPLVLWNGVIQPLKNPDGSARYALSETDLTLSFDTYEGDSIETIYLPV